ncbi:MAG TPA: DNA (cytosine-5-)-methyltransferase, partial [Candidatus Binataceae bacterium]|nr:DNA (cytosine-5-)-methyltransferase [Candidatus Binataceae bacterium]
MALRALIPAAAPVNYHSGVSTPAEPKTFHEFFAGGGMARLGLGPGWRCLTANEIDHKKAAVYRANFGHEALIVGDIATLGADDLRGHPDLAWASFPCQDLSLAGAGAGLGGARSGTFWQFRRLIDELATARRAPRLVVLENVCGAITSHGGKDFRAIADALAEAGYNIGALIIDAAHFLPQSRPRLFVIGASAAIRIPAATLAVAPDPRWTTRALLEVQRTLSPLAASMWRWWTMPAPDGRKPRLSDLIDRDPPDANWHTPQQTERLFSMMSRLNRAKVAAKEREAEAAGATIAGAVYKRTRLGPGNARLQRAEVRFD